MPTASRPQGSLCPCRYGGYALDRFHCCRSSTRVRLRHPCRDLLLFCPEHICSRGQRPGERSVGSSIERSVLLFLLVIGYAAMGRLLNHQRSPFAEWAWSSVPGGRGNLAWAPRWAGACWLRASCPGSDRRIDHHLLAGSRQFGILFVDLLLLAVASLAEEVAFRGYPFQRLIEAMGPTIGHSGFLHSPLPDCTFSIPAPIAPAF